MNDSQRRGYFQAAKSEAGSFGQNMALNNDLLIFLGWGYRAWKCFCCREAAERHLPPFRRHFRGQSHITIPS